MPASPARIAANRANSMKSTGPRTAEGKAGSRENAVKHGLTGEGVALPTEDVAAVAGRFEALREEIAPRTVLGGILVKRVAMLSVRLDRCVRQEASALATRVEHAAESFDEARMAEVERLFVLLDDDPPGAIRQIRRMPEGVDRLIAGWESLRDQLGPSPARQWYNPEYILADSLTGRRTHALGVSRIEALFRASAGDFRYLEEGEAAGLDHEARCAWGLARLAEVLDAQIAELRALRATLDLGAIARERARAADVALFDPSKDAVLARKYEAAAERALFRTLVELRQVEAEAKVEEEPTAPEAEEEAKSGSFSPDDRQGRPRPVEPRRQSPDRAPRRVEIPRDRRPDDPKA